MKCSSMEQQDKQLALEQKDIPPPFLPEMAMVHHWRIQEQILEGGETMFLRGSRCRNISITKCCFEKKKGENSVLGGWGKSFYFGLRDTL